jgi:hypothetical protein
MPRRLTRSSTAHLQTAALAVVAAEFCSYRIDKTRQEH